MKFISSRGNPLFKSLLRLTGSPRTRRAERAALLDGARLVCAYLERVGQPRAIVVSEAAVDASDVKGLLRKARPFESIVLSERLFAELSPLATPSGIVAVADIPAARPVPRDAACCLLVEDIQDPGNLGSILRSAAAAGVSHILLSKGCADAWSPRVLRGAMGAHFYLNIEERSNLIAFARDYDGQVVATVAGARHAIFDVDLRRPTALVIGNEGAGLSRGLLAEASLLAAVPMPGGSESINVAAAAAVCLFERVRQLRVSAKSA